jgi:hypothetical protein
MLLRICHVKVTGTHHAGQLVLSHSLLALLLPRCCCLAAAASLLLLLLLLLQVAIEAVLPLHADRCHVWCFSHLSCGGG